MLVDLSEIILLLGKSERDKAVEGVLHRLGLARPLPRPKRGEDQVNLLVPESPLELAFFDAESLFPGDTQYLEGELILHTLFIHPNKDHHQFRLPNGLSLPVSRKQAREVYGAPEWTSPIMKNDRWRFEGMKVLLCFTEDESAVKQVAVSYDGQQ